MAIDDTFDPYNLPIALTKEMARWHDDSYQKGRAAYKANGPTAIPDGVSPAYFLAGQAYEEGRAEIEAEKAQE